MAQHCGGIKRTLDLLPTGRTAERALKDRFKEFASESQVLQEFFQIQQEDHQSVTSFYETVIRKYRKVKEFITEQQVITVLQTGVKKSLKEYLIRKEKDIKKPEAWLQVAKEEEYVQKRIQQQINGFYPETANQVFFEPLLATATIQAKPSRNTQPRIPSQATQYQRWPEHQPTHCQAYNDREDHRPPRRTNETDWRSRGRPMQPCLICNRENHTTAKCLFKKENGCFKCGHTLLIECVTARSVVFSSNGIGRWRRSQWSYEVINRNNFQPHFR